jgi:hypothetical protein
MDSLSLRGAGVAGAGWMAAHSDAAEGRSWI